MNALIRGHTAVRELLRSAIASDRVAHAYAFVGPPGIGKRLTAQAFAQALLCPSRQVASSGGRESLGGCGLCPACQRVEAGAHPDCHLIVPSGQLIRIDQVRELERLAALKPHQGPLKVFIVDDAERMSLVTANALLKTLEEPPARTVIILILSQARALPPTALSRCQVVRFTPLGEAEAVALLMNSGVDEATAQFLARACQGQVGLVLGREPGLWRERRDQAVALLSEVASKGAEALFARVEALGRDRTQIAELIEAVWLWYRDLCCVKAGGAPRLLLSSDRQAELVSNAGATPWEGILAGLVACREAWQALEGNVSPRLTLEVLLSRLALRAA
ncbi:MAG: DNA polymerase III subunit delta' [Candidatus Methylomirabilia bacterium]